MDEDVNNFPPFSPSFAGSASVNSASNNEVNRRVRNITPKIQALRSLFETKDKDKMKEPDDKRKTSDTNMSGDATLVNDIASEGGPVSPIDIAPPLPPKDEPAFRAVANDRMTSSSSETPSAPTRIPPVPPKSAARLVKKLTGHKTPTAKAAIGTPSTKQQHVSEYLFDSWDMKCEYLADWADTVLSTGSRNQEINDNMAMQQPNDVGLDGEEEVKVEPTEVKLLTPEEDLAECVHPKSCHPQQTCLFNLILKELKKDVMVDPDDVSLKTRDRAMYLAYNSCRVPLVIRIECLHIMALHNGWSSVKQKEILELAWTHCHQLKTTPLMVDLMHKTQKLWVHRLQYPLYEMQDLECKPPVDGYTKDRTKCL